MGRTIEELKAKNAEYSREAGTKHSAQETLLRNLRAALQNAKTEKARLQSRNEDLSQRLKSQTLETEVSELRARERRAGEQAKKYRKAYEFQKNLLHKRSEQYLQTKARIRLLVGALRKHRVPLSPSIGSLLETPSLRNLLPRLNGVGMSTDQMMQTPLLERTAGSSGLGNRMISVSDISLPVESLSLDPIKSKIDDDDDGEDLVESPTMEPNPLSNDYKPQGRRVSLVDRGVPLPAPPGCEVPRSVLRMSPQFLNAKIYLPVLLMLPLSVWLLNT